MGVNRDGLSDKQDMAIELVMIGMNDGEIAKWLGEYNSIRPHAALGNKRPYKFSSNLEGIYLLSGNKFGDLTTHITQEINKDIKD